MSETYVYQPELRSPNYEEAVALLRLRYADVRVEWPDPLPHLDDISAGLRANRVVVNDLGPEFSDFAEYFRRAEYIGRYPEYYRHNLAEKAFEHYLALKLLQ